MHRTKRYLLMFDRFYGRYLLKKEIKWLLQNYSEILLVAASYQVSQLYLRSAYSNPTVISRTWYEFVDYFILFFLTLILRTRIMYNIRWLTRPYLLGFLTIWPVINTLAGEHEEINNYSYYLTLIYLIYLVSLRGMELQQKMIILPLVIVSLEPIITTGGFYQVFDEGRSKTIYSDARVWSTMDNETLMKFIKAKYDTLVSSREIENLFISIIVNYLKDQLGLEPRAEQINAALNMYNGNFVEVKTGEGKTLIIFIAAYLNVFIKRRVSFIITVNNYLAQRDYDTFMTMWKYLGVRAGLVTEHKQDDYMNLQVVYTTNSQFIFDYMSSISSPYNRVIMPRPKQVMLFFDEFDMSMWDNATSPFIVNSQIPMKFDKNLALHCLNMARKMKIDYHFKLDLGSKIYHLDDLGYRYIANYLLTKNVIKRANDIYDQNELLIYVDRALRAVYLMHKDIDYVIDKDKIVIINEFTSRLEPSKQFQDYLHGVLFLKEGLELTENYGISSSMLYTHFVNNFPYISGASGTSNPDKMQLIYQCRTIVAKTVFGDSRIDHPMIKFSKRNDMYNYACDLIYRLQKSHRAVLVLLTDIPGLNDFEAKCIKRGIKYSRIDALNEAKEDFLISQAGWPCQCTLSTHMPGRGTDIQLGGDINTLQKLINLRSKSYNDKEMSWYTRLQDYYPIYSNYVKDKGGLITIMLGIVPNSRVERQLKGRSARQGLSGEVYYIYSDEDPSLLEAGIPKSIFTSIWRGLPSFLQVRLIQRSLDFMTDMDLINSFREDWASHRAMEDFKIFNDFMNMMLMQGVSHGHGISWISTMVMLFKIFKKSLILQEETYFGILISNHISHYNRLLRGFWIDQLIKSNSEWLCDFLIFIQDVKEYSSILTTDSMMFNIKYIIPPVKSRITYLLSRLESIMIFNTDRLISPVKNPPLRVR